MALARLGITVSQGELNLLFELTPVGVPTSRLKRKVRGFWIWDCYAAALKGTTGIQSL
jgi:hypothetical protein